MNYAEFWSAPFSPHRRTGWAKIPCELVQEGCCIVLGVGSKHFFVYKCPSGSLQELTLTIRTTYSPRLPRSPIRSIRQVYGDFPFILHYVGTCMEGLNKITKISISMVGVATDIRTARFCNNVRNLEEPICTIACMCACAVLRSFPQKRRSDQHTARNSISWKYFISSCSLNVSRVL
jgi:hypothetical protein